MSDILYMPLIAQIDKWHEMGREFQSDHSKLAPELVFASLSVLAVVVVFLWLLTRLMNRTEGRRVFNNPKQLFRSLCRAHQLSSGERRLLVQIGRARQIAQPASLFLEPEQFDAAAEIPASLWTGAFGQTTTRPAVREVNAASVGVHASACRGTLKRATPTSTDLTHFSRPEASLPTGNPSRKSMFPEVKLGRLFRLHHLV